jgi:hypothetical protein
MAAMPDFFQKVITAALIGLLAMPAMAETPARAGLEAQTEKIVAAMPEFRLPLPADDTHPLIRITPQKPWMLRLGGDAASITIDDNTAGLQVLRYGEKSIALLSKRTGAAHITVKDAKGAILMSRGVLVPERGKKYIRIAAGCKGDGACAAPRIFYCPNLCYETSLARTGLN